MSAAHPPGQFFQLSGGGRWPVSVELASAAKNRRYGEDDRSPKRDCKDQTENYRASKVRIVHARSSQLEMTFSLRSPAASGMRSGAEAGGSNVSGFFKRQGPTGRHGPHLRNERKVDADTLHKRKCGRQSGRGGAPFAAGRGRFHGSANRRGRTPSAGGPSVPTTGCSFEPRSHLQMRAAQRAWQIRDGLQAIAPRPASWNAWLRCARCLPPASRRPSRPASAR